MKFICHIGLLILCGTLGLSIVSASETESLVCADQVLLQSIFRFCVVAPNQSRMNVVFDFQKAFRKIGEVDETFNEVISTSDIAKVNQAAGAKAIQVHASVINLLKLGLSVSVASDGAYDPTLGSILPLYDFSKAGQLEPTDIELKEKMALVNYRNIEVDEKKSAVFLKKAGMKINVRELALGLASDEAALILKKVYRSGFVENGEGSLYWGANVDGIPWAPEIKDVSNEQLLMQIRGSDFALSTLTDSRRFFFNGARRVHEVLDAHTGRPAERSRQVIILTTSALQASAYHHAAFVLGPLAAASFLSKNGISGILSGQAETVLTADLHPTKQGKLQTIEVPNRKSEHSANAPLN